MSLHDNNKKEEPVMGFPYQGPPPMQAQYQAQGPPPMSRNQYQEYPRGQHPAYQAGMIPSNAIYDHPRGVPLQQTMFKDTPAPFSCVYCGNSGLTYLKHKPSLAAAVGCIIPFGLGCCFLCPSMDCLWHKYHYCPSCNEKVADFEKTDACLVIDPPQWSEPSFAVPL